METSGSLPQFENSIFDVTVVVDNPLSGFEFSIMETGAAATAVDLIQFSGQEGYIFDQSGNFFGGYQSGIPFDISIHYDWVNTGFKYYFEDVLIANNLKSFTGVLNEMSNKANQIEFQKYGNSTLNVSVNGAGL
tara:strand:- start:5582 stop:5983 length:402 start_codon:yes stop_codon:yes gene_type:complete